MKELHDIARGFTAAKNQAAEVKKAKAAAEKLQSPEQKEYAEMYIKLMGKILDKVRAIDCPDVPGCLFIFQLREAAGAHSKQHSTAGYLQPSEVQRCLCFEGLLLVPPVLQARCRAAVAAAASFLNRRNAVAPVCVFVPVLTLLAPQPPHC